MSHPLSKKLAGLIDHTLLKPNSSESDHIQLCKEAKKWGFRTVCVFPQFVAMCAELLKGTATEVCTVIDFPKGLGDVANNVVDVAMATSDGAMEIDMVMDIDAFKSKNYEKVAIGIHNVVEAAEGRIVKIIIESCLWNDDQIKMACQIVQSANGHFIKTSSGFSKSGASISDVKVIRETVGDVFGVKASGGIKSYENALSMIQAGANRIGTSSGADIMKGIHHLS